MMSILSIICSIAGLFPFNVKAVSATDWQETTKVVYRHSDGSIAPDYYRSYTLTVTKDSITVVVSNYSDILLTKQIPHSLQGFRTFIGKLQKAGIKKVKEVKSLATGGSTESIMLYKGDDNYFSAYKTSDGGDLKLDRGRLKAIIHEFMPELEGIVHQTIAPENRLDL